MTKVNRAADAESGPLKTVLSDGVSTISRDESIEFRLYERRILPLDGFVFWIASDLLANPAPNSLIKVKGSVHRSVSNQQSEDQTHSLGHMVFTTTERVDNFNAQNPEKMWVCEIEGVPFAFSSMLDKFLSAGLYHYRGDSISPIVRAQMITRPEDMQQHQLVVSNALPLFMQLTRHGVVYPSYLVASNVRPPYMVVDVRETTALQAAPFINDQGRWQLVKDVVRVTLIGMDNGEALQYRDYIVNSAFSDEEFGVLNAPVVRDVKMVQSEINALAMKKTIDFEINYYQQTAHDIALQLINQVLIAVEVKS